jgi:hypothetical protein
MQNVLYIYNDFGNGQLDVIEIFSKPFHNNTFINFILTSHLDSLFNLKIDIYCVYKDGSYLFSMNHLPLKSDIILDFNEFKSELRNYLKIYLDVQHKLVKTPEENLIFKFKHNLIINEKNIIVDFYKKYAKDKIWSIEIGGNMIKNEDHLDSIKLLGLLDDFLKCLVSLKNPNDKHIFFLSCLNYLPLDIILHVIPLILPKDHSKKVYFYYKLFDVMNFRKKFNLAYLYTLKAVSELKQTLDIKMAEYFLEKSQKFLKNDNWAKILNEVEQILKLENKKTFGDEIWESSFDQKRDLEILSLKITPNNSIFKKQDDSEIFNLKKDLKVCCELLKIEIKVNESVYLEEIEVLNEFDYEKVFRLRNERVLIPVYKHLVKGSNSILLPIPFLQKFKITKFIFKNHKSHFIEPILFEQIKRKHKIQLKDVLIDENRVIYNFIKDEGCRIFTTKPNDKTKEVYVNFLKNEKKTILYEITEKYVEEVELLT